MAEADADIARDARHRRTDEHTGGELIDLAMLDRFGELGASVLGVADAEINRQAALIAYFNDFSVMKWLANAAAPLVFLMRRPPDLQRGN